MTQPTEPIPYVPPPDQLPPKSWLRRHLGSAAAIAAAVAVAAIAIGFGVAAARSGDSTWTETSQATPPRGDTPPGAIPTAAPSSTAPPSRARPSAGARTIVRAAIVSMSDSGWSVRTRAGVLATVVVTPETRFGVDGDRASSDRFSPGEDVVIVGSASGGTMTADWIVGGRPSG